jgi:hypothetical protein
MVATQLNVATERATMLVLHHHQPINVPTAGEQAFLMDYPQGERDITHHAGPVRIGGEFAYYIFINVMARSPLV